ncbi:MAG: hypothetical protein KDB35_14060 [Acidimicrobiales bacterium]|nr:hypothetical protein [Acidimicrobiales bacterium]MCB1016506.1 hypothetical protein [Acidimicrobiales bacterium]
MPTEPTEPTPARPGAAAVAPALPQPHPRPRTRTNPGHSADSAATWFGASLLLFFLTLVVPVAVMGQNFGPLGRVSTLLALFVTWYAALRLAGHYRTGRPHLVQITFWAFVYLFMGLASFAQLTADTFPIRNQFFGESIRVQALVGVVIGLLAFDVGRLVALGVRRHRLRARLERRVVDARRVWVLGVAGIVCTMGVVMTNGGLATRFQSRQRAEEALYGIPPWGVRIDQLDDKTLGLIKTSLTWLPVFLGLVLLLFLRQSATARFGPDRPVRWIRTPATTLLLWGLVLVNVVANNPIANPRIRFGGVAFAVALVLFHVERPRRMRAFLVGLVLLVLVVFPYADLFRYDVQQTIKVATLRDQLVDSPDYAMFQQEMNGIVYVQEHGYTRGRQTLGAVLFAVPKSVWADQPEATGDLISRTDDINASSTLWTEANVEAGWPAIVLVFVAYGLIAMLADESYERWDRRRPSVIGIAVPLFAAFQFFVLRGALLPVVGDLLPIVVIVALCTRRARRTAPAADAEGGADQAVGVAADRSALANARP